MLFDMDSLLDAQISLLGSTRATGIKQVSVGDQRDSVQLAAGSQTWKSELESFRQLGVINRPAYRDLYQIRNINQDSVFVKTFHASGDLPSSVELALTYSGGRLQRLSGTYSVHNNLYNMLRQVELEFGDYQGKPILMRYTVTGVQKMVVGDSVQYSLDGKVMVSVTE
jgi:hypothetical protein